MLTKAPLSLRTWAAHFAESPVPVRSYTAARLAAMAGRAEDVAVGDLAPLVLADPMMTVKLLAYVAQIRAMRGRTPAETVAQAILMIGVPPFFRAFADPPVIETVLAAWPRAQAGIARVLDQSWRAADMALALAVMRKDPDAEVIHEAALMHDFVEMLLWCHAPELAMQVEDLIDADPARDRSRAERTALNIELCDLEQTLVREWHLPELLVRVTNDRASADSQARTVQLASRIARHLRHGWESSAVQADLEAAADLLGLTPDAIRERLQKLDHEGFESIPSTPGYGDDGAVAPADPPPSREPSDSATPTAV